MPDKDPAKEVAKILCAVQEKEVLDYDKDPVHNREQRHHYEVEENHEDLVDLEETRILNYNGDLQVIKDGNDYDGIAEDGLEEGEIEDDDIYDTDSDNNYSDDDDLEYDELKNQGETGNESHGVEISDDPSEGEADEVVLINDVRPDEVDLQDLLDIERNEINQNDNQALPPLPASLPTVSSNSTPGRPLPAIPRSRTTPNFPPGLDVYHRPLLFQEQNEKPPNAQFVRYRWVFPPYELRLDVVDLSWAEHQLFWDRRLGPYRCQRPSCLRRCWTRV